MGRVAIDRSSASVHPVLKPEMLPEALWKGQLFKDVEQLCHNINGSIRNG